MKKHTATLGSVSSGTMRPEDLIPTFCSELRYLGARDKELTRIERQCARVNSDKYYESEDADWDLEWLFDKLNEFAPAYCYFGAHPGDGADYGFWVNEDFASDNLDSGEFDGLRVNDLSELPARYTGEVMHVNDHGNMTLYTSCKGKLTEVWSIV